MVVHAHGTLWRERGFITVSGQRISHGSLIKRLLEALMLPLRIAVIHVRDLGRGPGKGLKLSPFELVFGFPPRILIPGFREDVNWEMGKDSLWKQVSGLQSVSLQLHRYAVPFQALPLDQPVHPFQIGDQVLVKKWKREPLTP
ncbi:hypothetical protein G0U57_009530, partial [Chelydra serpentina]